MDLINIVNVIASMATNAVRVSLFGVVTLARDLIERIGSGWQSDSKIIVRRPFEGEEIAELSIDDFFAIFKPLFHTDDGVTINTRKQFTFRERDNQYIGKISISDIFNYYVSQLSQLQYVVVDGNRRFFALLLVNAIRENLKMTPIIPHFELRSFGNPDDVIIFQESQNAPDGRDVAKVLTRGLLDACYRKWISLNHCSEASLATACGITQRGRAQAIGYYCSALHFLVANDFSDTDFWTVRPEGFVPVGFYSDLSASLLPCGTIASRKSDAMLKEKAKKSFDEVICYLVENPQKEKKAIVSMKEVIKMRSLSPFAESFVSAIESGDVNRVRSVFETTK